MTAPQVPLVVEALSLLGSHSDRADARNGRRAGERYVAVRHGRAEKGLEMRRVGKDPEGGWITRRRDGTMIPDDGFRWNSRAAVQGAIADLDIFDPFDADHVRTAFGLPRRR